MSIIQLNEEQRDVLKKAVKESVDSKYLEQGQKNHQKDITKRMKDELEIPSKFYNKLVKLAYEDSGRRQNDELTEVLDLAEEIGYYSHEEESE